ncbi:MAG: NADH-quinone oxidoreductase subunit I [Bacteroidia bacterium]|jgi:NADH-quinone oxidoreductase subunit I|nr:NADH-quinone oxidoreductase subunit I [Bacteroidia bacterium]
MSSGYFEGIVHTVKSLWTGLRLTGKHLYGRKKNRGPVSIGRDDYFHDASGTVTIQYPTEQLPVPDNGRYRLDMEAEDCIVCDKCARICPVDCITIESFKAVEDLGLTSDGSKKRLELPVFDIDMGKCCFCGLCTTVCPTECLTMTKVYDFSEYDRDNLIYHFGILSPEEEAEKRRKLADIQAVKS